MSRRLVFGVVALFFVFDSSGQSIKFNDDRVIVDDLNSEVLFYFVRYRNKPEVWNEVFPVRVYGASLNIAGSYRIGESNVTFVPDFPFARGVDYEATFFTSELAQNRNEVHLPYMDPATLSLKFRLTESTSPAPRVTNVYPTADELPENLLRFHIEFSSPMTHGDLYTRVHIVDEENKEVEKAILVVDEELWDDGMRSVTVMLDPGRIKRGLRANVEMNAPLIAGRTYSLVIDAGWKNSEGVAMKESFTKTFRCTPADRRKPAPANWALVSPTASNDPLVLKTNESFDIVLARHAIVVKDSRGNNIRGTLTVSDRESTLTFVPDVPWAKEKYSVLVNPKLEDLAGNNMLRLFDTDLEENTAGLSGAMTFSF